MMQESGVYDARPRRPALSVGDPCLNPGAAMVGGLVDVMGMFLQGGWVDVGFLSGTQVDKYGNINTTVIGDYDSPKSRLPGSGGANPIGSLVKRVLIIALHDPGGCPNGSISSPRRATSTAPGPGRSGGFPPTPALRSSSPTRRSCGSTRRPRRPTSRVIIPGTPSTRSELQRGWDLQVADDVHETEPPRAEELRVIREVLDPHRMIKIYEGKGYV